MRALFFCEKATKKATIFVPEKGGIPMENGGISPLSY